MIHKRITSIHQFIEQYVTDGGNMGTEQVFLTINHEERTFSIHPEMPMVGFDSAADPRHRYASINTLAFEYADIDANHARFLARHACIQAALFYAIDALELSTDSSVKELFELYNLLNPANYATNPTP